MIPSWVIIASWVALGLVAVYLVGEWAVRTAREERTLPVVQVECSLCEEWAEAMVSTPENERVLRRRLERHLSSVHAAKWLAALGLRSGTRALGLWTVHPPIRAKDPVR